MRVVAHAPASTSNLGGGFDCVGISVDRWLHLEARLKPAGEVDTTLTREGTLGELEGAAEDDLLCVGFATACRVARRALPSGLVLHASSDIPVGRGLGSSAAALVAGAGAANALLDLGLDDATIATLCAEIEGHPDNVGACVHGGATLAVRGTDQSTILSPIPVHESLRLAFAVPDFKVDTHLARAALPSVISHLDARRAVAASAALVLALTSGDPALLRAGLEGPLHIPHRRPLVRGYDVVVQAVREAGGVGATLSGSGSAIVALATADDATRVAAAMEAAWRAEGVTAVTFVSEPRTAGYRVERFDSDTSTEPRSSAYPADAAHISEHEVTT